MISSRSSSMPMSCTLSIPFSTHGVRSGCCPVRCGRTGVLFPKDETHFRGIHHATSQSSMSSWVHTFPSTCLSGRCCSPGTASYLAASQRLTGYRAYPEGLPVRRDHSSIPSYSFHGVHMECTPSWCVPRCSVVLGALNASPMQSCARCSAHDGG